MAGRSSWASPAAALRTLQSRVGRPRNPEGDAQPVRAALLPGPGMRWQGLRDPANKPCCTTVHVSGGYIQGGHRSVALKSNAVLLVGVDSTGAVAALLFTDAVFGRFRRFRRCAGCAAGGAGRRVLYRRCCCCCC